MHREVHGRLAKAIRWVTEVGNSAILAMVYTLGTLRKNSFGQSPISGVLFPH